MGLMHFIKTEGTEEYVFRKDSFRFMQATYSSGATGTVNIYFAAEGNIVDPDLIALTVNKDFVAIVMSDVSKSLNNTDITQVKHSQTGGIYKQVTAMVYTAG